MEVCELCAKILENAFATYTLKGESKDPRLIIFIEEAHRVLKKYVSKDAREAAEECEKAITKYVREMGKFGGYMYLISQSIMDFSYDTSIIRKNCEFKLFFLNSGSEIDNAGEFLKDGRAIVNLKQGTAIKWDSRTGESKIKIRPPFSLVKELTVDETRKLINGDKVGTLILSEEEQAVIKIVGAYHKETGSYINLTKLADKLGITSKRKIQDIVNKIEGKGCIKTKTLAEKGKPRVIIPASNEPENGNNIS